MILGAGVTGLAAGIASGLPVYEAEERPGGICSSYYMRPGSAERLHNAPADGQAYRFEIGGGHWIFGGDPVVLSLINSLSPVERYTRKSSVYLPQLRLSVPYPLQNNLRYLPPDIGIRALHEMLQLSAEHHTVQTMSEWLRASFGPTLCDLFFNPFHDLYTAGLYMRIAPQDSYKSPVSMHSVVEGLLRNAPAAGYNTTFIYPREGLNALTQRMAAACDVHYGKCVVSIDVSAKQVWFADGSHIHYERLISTLPLNTTIGMTELTVKSPPDPSPSVLVVNVGALRGPRCPDDHWVYLPNSAPSFHRVGFYSNVDPGFLPRSSAASRAPRRVSIYVEKAYLTQPAPDELEAVCRAVVRQLQDWDWITEAEAIDPTWIKVAYTWSWPHSPWRKEALQQLELHDIFSVGRYARWVFQGIADSMRDGFVAGGAMSAIGVGAASFAPDNSEAKPEGHLCTSA